ncbi:MULTISPECIES: enoyl-CoA hydratase/isomerase family protein [Mycobacterium avium complex (MAC)]|uniref:enoyl-CoA hydratase/isomerase family protein n=1 Tax=Mycobacterium avium complex (MAC) TaxID=120793 RepID=UPI001915F570|nr:enoyl-CoA hydratase-related protein [Mycobacterium paraintracellulare]BCP08075.1 enoyl-CoA hydratase [Mycobacterium paraintracellulare]
MELQRILFDVSDHIATITINRPERLNATDDLTRTELGWAWGRVRDDPDIRVAIITGAGDRAFSAGQDIRATAESGIRNKVPGSRLHHGVWKPVICALNGMVVGGGLHQVADADLIIAAEHAELIDTHLKVGNVFTLEPAVLLRRMPISMVMQLALMTKDGRISAQRGYEIGLINEVVPADRLQSRAREIAQAITKLSPATTQASIKGMWTSLDVGLHSAHEVAYRYVLQHQLSHPDYHEGMRAFAEKREPQWVVE